MSTSGDQAGRAGAAARGGEAAQAEQEIYSALQSLRDEPYGAARSARTEELAETAEQLELNAPLATALVQLVEAYEYGGEQRKTPVVFARLLKLHDDDPAAFNDWEAHRVYWYFKWITASLLGVPEVPLATIEGWVGRMRERYTAAGHPLSAVHSCLFMIAQHTGSDMDTAYEHWATRPRDEFSDCEACEARRRGTYWAARDDGSGRDVGEDARALREWGPVLDGRLGCQEEPAATISHALLPLVRVGRLDEAASFHRSGYRATRGKVAMAGEAGRHIEFAALTGNGPRGLELLAENRGRFESAAEPEARLSFLGGVRVLLTALAAQGHGAVPVAGPADRAHTVESLLAYCAAETDAIAARFDARNGTSYWGDGLRARVAQQQLTAEPLPLGVRSEAALLVAPLDAVGAGGTGGTSGTGGDAEGNGAGGGDGSGAATGVSGRGPASGSGAGAGAGTGSGLLSASRTTIPDDFATLLEQARAANKSGHPDGDVLWDAVARRVDGSGLEDDDLLCGELANRAAFKLVEAEDWTGARESFLDARARLDAAGRPSRSAAAWSRAVWCSALIDLERQLNAPDSVDAVESGASIDPTHAVDSSESAEPFMSAEAFTPAEPLTLAGPTEPAELAEPAEPAEPAEDAEPAYWAEFDAVLAHAESLLDGSTDPEHYTIVLHSRAATAAALCFPRNGREAAPDAAALARCMREATAFREGALRLGVTHRAALASSLLGNAYAFLGDMERAEPAMREAIALLEQSGRPWALPQLLFQLASIVGRSQGGLDEAATLMHRALSLLAEWPDPEVNLGRTSLMLAQNRARAGDFTAASRHFTTAAARFDRDGDAVAAAGARASLGQMLTAADRYADAAAVLESLIEEEAEPRLPPEQRAQARLDLGRSLMAQEEPRAAAEVFGWLADFVTHWPDRSVTTMTACELGIALFAAEMPDEGHVAVRRALAAHAESPDPVDLCRLLRVAAEAAYRGQGAATGGGAGTATGDGADGVGESGSGSGSAPASDSGPVSGVEAALAYLRQADEINEAAREFEDETGRYRRWPERALNADQRAKALAEAERYEEALTAAEQSAAAWEEGGPQTLDRVAEAVRIAGVIEGYRLGRAKEAVERVTSMLERCRAADRERAVNTLTQLVEGLKQQM